MMFNKKFVIGLVILSVIGAGNVLAQVCGDGICQPALPPAGNSETNASCPGDCAARCGDCTIDTDCETLECTEGKCRGCFCDTGQICFCNPLKACGFEELVDKIVDYLFYIVIAATPIMLVIAGFYFTTAAGDAKRIATAKTIIIWTLVGLFVVLMAKGIIGIIRTLLG